MKHLVCNLLVLLSLHSFAKAAGDDFFRPAPDAGVSLPANRIYPQGRLFPFSGFSGKPEREKANGFTMHGPVYGAHQLESLEAAEKAGLFFPYTVGLDMQFKTDQALDLTEAEIKDSITRQVSAVAARTSICWWYLKPEEMRYWRNKEMAYLKAACEAIHAADPLKRPVWMYEPNNRSSASLVQTGRNLDLIGKGAYVNYAGYQDRRVWVRWGMEQETDAIRQLGGNHTPLLLPELAKDPDPGRFNQIPGWVRHDVYCGLIHGAKGVVIWSLFKRPAVRQSFDIWYEAYAQAARQLTGERKLGEVFLFGEERHDLTLKQLDGPITVTLHDKERRAEAASLTQAEKSGMNLEYPALSWRELARGTARYLFICNSSPQAVRAAVSGFPAASKIEEADTGAAVDTEKARQLELPAWGVRALKFTRAPVPGKASSSAALPKLLLIGDAALDEIVPLVAGRLKGKMSVVLAPDAWYYGDRAENVPSGPDDVYHRGIPPHADVTQNSLLKLNLWLGRTMWGMMVRDDRIALDYLCQRPEVDANRIGATGMSMGSTRSWWLAAVDERVAATIGVACPTRYENLIRHGNLRAHGL